MTDHNEQMKALGRAVSGHPDWTDAPAVQAWHRSDRRTERDGTPGKPRIWSPDYGTTERWSTPSLRNVHWSDLVDVTPLDEVAPVRKSQPAEQPPFSDYLGQLSVARHQTSEASKVADEQRARAEKAEQERDEARNGLRRALHQRDAARAEQSRPLTADDITDEMVERVWGEWCEKRVGDMDDLGDAIRAALIPPPARPEGAEELADLMETYSDAGSLEANGLDGLADYLTSAGYRKAGGEDQ